ncbi:hypothetical protein [Streptomyces sp. NPDC050564]|uniref:hypothetical protein n=1 Tax=Streptomyces sp. NPDC050564 TaxID=3365631 RepID=UPI003789CC3C
MNEPTVITGIRPGLAIRTATGCGGRQTPVADWLCACGHHERAVGKDVADLAARVIVGICPHQTAAKEAA